MGHDGKLQKFRIYAFSDPTFDTEVIFAENDDKYYELAINPEVVSLDNKSKYGSENATGSSTGGVKYHKSIPENLSVEFMFDRTGVFKDSPSLKNGVIDDLKLFKKITFEYNGDTHKPNYLKISWGSLLFTCVVTEFNLEYKLFNSSGKPIRAIVKVNFKHFVDEDKRAAKEKKSSPDLTHYRIVKEGDTLPLMTHRIYGDSKYYLKVANVNGLTNFRKLKAGQKITFPPIDKVG